MIVADADNTETPHNQHSAMIVFIYPDQQTMQKLYGVNLHATLQGMFQKRSYLAKKLVRGTCNLMGALLIIEPIGCKLRQFFRA